MDGNKLYSITNTDPEESGKFYHTVFENSLVGIVQISLDGTFKKVNKQFSEITGYSKEELSALGFKDITPPDDMWLDKAYALRMIAGDIDSFEIEKKCVHKNGHLIWVKLYSNVIRDDNGAIDYIISMISDITDSRNTEEKLRHSEEMYRTLTEFSLVGVLMIQDEKIVYANPTIREIGGYTLEEMLDKSPMGFVHPDDRQMVAQSIQEKIDGKEKYSRYEYRGLRKDGQTRWLEVSATYVEYRGRSASLSTIIDITDRIRFQNLIKRKLEIEKTISSVSSLFVAPNDLDSALDKSLISLGKLCGCDRCYIFLINEDNELMDNTHEWCAEGVTPQKDNLQSLPTNMFPWWMQKLNSEEIIHITNISLMPFDAANEKEILEMQGINSLIALPLHISGKMAGFVGMDNVVNTSEWSDDDIQVLGTFGNLIGSVIERKQNEEVINRSSLELKDAYEQLKSLDTLKSELLSNLSHELITPLNSINGYSNLLYDGELGELSETQKKTLNLIILSTERLSQLIDSLLFTGNVLAGKVDYEFEPIIVKNIVNRAIDCFSSIAQLKNLSLTVNITEPLPLIVGDSTFLSQMLDKIVDNAIKFTPEGGSIYIKVYEEKESLHLEVKDTGIGIPKNKQKAIFQSFYQVDASSKRKFGGTGIGLYISKMIVDAHCGNIWIESEEGVGTTLHIILPTNANRLI